MAAERLNKGGAAAFNHALEALVREHLAGIMPIGTTATIELHHGETPRAGTSRQEIQAGRESSARQMAEIRRFIFDLFSEDEDDNEEDTRKWSNLAPYYGGERLPPGRTLPSTAPRRIVPE